MVKVVIEEGTGYPFAPLSKVASKMEDKLVIGLTVIVEANGSREARAPRLWLTRNPTSPNGLGGGGNFQMKKGHWMVIPFGKLLEGLVVLPADNINVPYPILLTSLIEHAYYMIEYPS